MFKPVDWSEYNRPPYFPQWLARGETLDLAKHGDGQLESLETQVAAVAEQYDIYAAKGFLLNRIGKILAEPRNGIDDEVYRWSLPDYVNLVKRPYPD